MSCCNECEENNGCNDCGGNCGEAKVIITKQGLKGEDGYGYNAASTTSTNVLDTLVTSVATTITSEKAYTTGARVRFSDSSNPTVNYFEGIVGTYIPTTGFMNVIGIDLKSGSGTIASWNVNLAGELPNALADRYGYTTSSATTINLTSLPSSITVETYKSFKSGDIIRVEASNGYYFESQVASYIATTGVMNLTPPSFGIKRVGDGSYSSWVVTLINKEQVYKTLEQKLVYHAKRVFSDAGTTYIPVNGEDNSIDNFGEIMVFDPANPDVTIITSIPNSIINPFSSPQYDDITTTPGFARVKAIEIDLFLPMTNVGEDLAGDKWIIPKNISGTDVFESGSFNIIKISSSGTASTSHIDDPTHYETFRINVNKNTKTIATTWRINYADGQSIQDVGGGGGFSDRFRFYLQNATDLAIKGGLYPQTGSDLQRQYAIRIYV